MRYVTEHSDHVYTTKPSAMRAARNEVGHSYVVETPELENRFDGVIPITTDMINVESCEGGWRWSYTFNLADVIVRVRHADGEIADVRYADVAHWQDATHPCDEGVRIVSAQAADYLRALDNAESDEARLEIQGGTLSTLMIMSRDAGVDLGDIFSACRAVENALLSSNPHYIAEVILRAQPLGLVSDELRAHLRTWARRRGVSPSNYLRMAEEALSQQAA